LQVTCFSLSTCLDLSRKPVFTTELTRKEEHALKISKQPLTLKVMGIKAKSLVTWALREGFPQQYLFQVLLGNTRICELLGVLFFFLKLIPSPEEGDIYWISANARHCAQCLHISQLFHPDHPCLSKRWVPWSQFDG
jgi:hypothetical protein